MKGLKKFIVASCVAAAVLGMAATASAKTPKIQKTITVQLFREKASSGNKAWWVDKATSLIAIRNLKWNAKVFEISTSNNSCTIKNRAYGAYYLDICASKSVAPGYKNKVTFLIKQDGNYYVMNTTIKFVKAVSPLANFTFTGKTATGHTYTKEFSTYFAGQRTYEYTLPAGVTTCVLDVAVAAPQTAVKLVGTIKKNCKEVQMFNGNMYDMTKFYSIKVMYKTEIGAAPKYFKEESPDFEGTKRFPVNKYCLLVLK
jgi:hypothetical protein